MNVDRSFSGFNFNNLSDVWWLLMFWLWFRGHRNILVFGSSALFVCACLQRDGQRESDLPHQSLWLDYRLDDITQAHPHTFHQTSADSPAVTGRAFRWITRLSEEQRSSRGEHVFGNNPDGINYSSTSREILYCTSMFGCMTSYNIAVNKSRIKGCTCSHWPILPV